MLEDGRSIRCIFRGSIPVEIKVNVVPCIIEKDLRLTTDKSDGDKCTVLIIEVIWHCT